jgi:ATP-dependent helicase/nuclease subunit A
VEALAECARRAPSIRAAIHHGWRLWREVPVATEVDGVLLEGFVDVIVETPEGLQVIDYKTDRVDDVDAAVAQYRRQGAAYAVALEANLGRPVARCTFVFVRSPEPIERDVDDVPSATAEVRCQLAGLR